MIALVEDRLELAVESRRLGPGESVIILTKMGDEVARGIVIEVYPDASVYVRESGPDNTVKADRIFAAELYSFIPMHDDRDEGNIDPGDTGGHDVDDEPGMPSIAEQDPDVRAEKKMKETGTELEPKNGDDEDPGSDGGTSGKGGPRSKVDVDALPEHLKKEIIGLDGLDESERNKVMSAISDAALRSLRDVGVRDTEVYATIVKIQKAVISAMGV